GWLLTDEEGNVKEVSVKKALSDDPMNDHAIVATFWFRKGQIFKELTNRMIEKDDRINQEFYVDQVMKYAVEAGYRTKVFEIEKYIGWGTPEEYEYYQNTIKYWTEFVFGPDFLGHENE
ncbi:MAG: nucleotidyltransferase, partial [Clostridia bacterium]|nr:nucleotidyltransferase [Clostridia bacterium]